jgi:hypothetical protein
MKNIRMRMMLGVGLLLATLLVVGGCSRHYVDVYLNEIGSLVLLDGDPDNIIDPLWVYKDDYVIFNNTRSKAITLTFPLGMFEVDEVVVDGGRRAILQVVADGPSEGTISVSGDGIPAGSPKVKVGEGP